MVFVRLNGAGAQQACQASGEEQNKWSEFIHSLPPDGAFIPNNHTFVCFVISRRFVLRVLRFSAASSDAVTVLLRWRQLWQL